MRRLVVQSQLSFQRAIRWSVRRLIKGSRQQGGWISAQVDSLPYFGPRELQTRGIFIHLERSYLEVELCRNSHGADGFKADSNTHASDNNNTRWTYVTNNIGHTIFQQMNLYLNGIVMSAEANTYVYQAFLETLLNYTRDEGETLLAPQGWVNYLDVTPSLTAEAVDDDQVTMAGWQHNQCNPLKTPPRFSVTRIRSFYTFDHIWMLSIPDGSWSPVWKSSWNCSGTRPSFSCMYALPRAKPSVYETRTQRQVYPMHSAIEPVRVRRPASQTASNAHSLPRGAQQDPSYF